MNGQKVIHVLQNMTTVLKEMNQKLDGMNQKLDSIDAKLDRLPERIAHHLESSVFGKHYEREAEADVFTYALAREEMPLKVEGTPLAPLAKRWHELADGLYISDAHRIYVIQAKVNARDYRKAVAQLREVVQVILEDLKKHGLKEYRVVPVLAFEHVDHPGRLVANFKRLKRIKGAEPPLLLLEQGIMFTHKGDKIYLYE